MRVAILAAAIATLTSCDETAPPISIAQQEFSWRSVSDGSRIAMEGAEGNEAIRRCWPDKGGWGCIHVQHFGSSFFASRYHRSQLNERQDLDSIIGGEGYACHFSGGMESDWVVSETIANEYGTLVENVLDLRSGSGSFWTPTYVSQFIAQNAVGQDRLPFPCAELAKRLVLHGLAPLTSTALTKQDILR